MVCVNVAYISDSETWDQVWKIVKWAQVFLHVWKFCCLFDFRWKRCSPEEDIYQMGQQASPEGMQAGKQKQDNWFKFSVFCSVKFLHVTLSQIKLKSVTFTLAVDK